MGPADGKLMVGMACPGAAGVCAGALLEAIVFIVLRLRGRGDAAITGALWLYAGSLLGANVLIVLSVHTSVPGVP